MSVPAAAQVRTDVATLGNGDRITGTVEHLERGRLEFKTDDAGTLYFEWDKLQSVVARGVFEVVTSDGRRFVGALEPADPRSIAVSTAGGLVPLPMTIVVLITPIGGGFWSKLDGSIDAGFSYTRSSGVAQLNFDSETLYRGPAFAGRLSISATQTRIDEDSEEGGGNDDRASIEASYLRYPWQRWFVFAATRFESNESLGLLLRSELSFTAGPRLINTNRAQMTVGAGISVNDERGVDVESTRNVEGVLTFRTAYYTYDRPRTTLDISLQYYPSLSNPGRHRLQLDAGVKQELWKDLFVSASLYNTYDSRPPNPSANTNDVGLVTSIGWTY